MGHPFERQHKLASWKEYQEWEHRHRAFNLALISGCNLSHLLQIQERLYRQTERYRRLWVLESLEHRDKLQFAQKQQKIMKAALDRDKEEASRLLFNHFHKACESIRAYLEKRALI